MGASLWFAFAESFSSALIREPFDLLAQDMAQYGCGASVSGVHPEVGQVLGEQGLAAAVGRVRCIVQKTYVIGGVDKEIYNLIYWKSLWVDVLIQRA